MYICQLVTSKRANVAIASALNTYNVLNAETLVVYRKLAQGYREYLILI